MTDRDQSPGQLDLDRIPDFLDAKRRAEFLPIRLAPKPEAIKPPAPEPVLTQE